MRTLYTRLYSFALPLLLLPLMDFSFSEIPGYLKGLEFRQFLSEIISQILSGVLDAAIVASIQAAFGLVG